MNNIEEQAKKFLKEECDSWEDGENVYADCMTVKDLVKFARLICEEQKIDCLYNASIDTINLMDLPNEEGIDLKLRALQNKDNKVLYLICDNQPYIFRINRSSILHTKNICDE